MNKIDKQKALVASGKVIHFRPLFFVFLSFLVGIIFARKIYSGEIKYILLTLLIFAVLFAVCLKNKKIIPFVICFLIFSVGNGMYFLSINPYNNAPYFEKTVAVVGRVTDNISDHGYSKVFVLDNVNIDGTMTKNIRVEIKGVEDYVKTGDLLSFEAIPKKILLFDLGNFHNDYVRDNVLYETSVFYEDITVASGSMHLDEIVRNTIKQCLLSNMSEENAYIAYAVLTGEKSGINSEIYNDYKGTGILHLLTVSGLHVGIFASFISFILKKSKANKWLRFGLTAIILIAYSYICGFAPSVIRASIMSLVFLLSFIVGKQHDSLSSIGLAGLIICIVNPLFAFDAGFLMSFFCVIMINLLYNPVFNLFNKFMPKWASSYISLSICAQIGTLPFLASFYSSFNFLSLFVNLLVVPAFTFVFVSLLLFTVLTIILDFMGFLLIVSDILFSALNFVAFFYNTPTLSVALSPISEGVIIISFFLICALSSIFMLEKQTKVFVSLTLCAVLVAFTALTFIPSKNENSEIYYICNSYSDGVLLRSKKGKTLLVGNLFTNTVNRFIDYQNIDNIDYVVTQSEISESAYDFYLDNHLQGLVTTVLQPDYVLVPKFTLNGYKKIGDFELYNVIFNEESLGLMLWFDNTSVFFAFKDYLDYNMCDYVWKNFNYCDLTFVNYETVFTRQDFAKWNITKNYTSKADYCYGKHGNIKIEKENNILKARGID